MPESEMDRSRRQSRERDRNRNPFPEVLSARLRDDDLSEGQLSTHGAYRVLRKARRGTNCPDCGDSLALMQWSTHRQLWVHERCGAIRTMEEMLDG